MSRAPALAIALTLALLTACTTTPPPAVPTPALPPLVGTWTGTWGGQPLTLTIAEQKDFDSRSGVYLGPVMVIGRHEPGVSGVMTYTVRGEPISVNVRGWLGYADGAITLLLDSEGTQGLQQLTLKNEAGERLVGSGSSSVSWGPQGPVELRRQPRA
jgi:hypothetical protein